MKYVDSAKHDEGDRTHSDRKHVGGKFGDDRSTGGRQTLALSGHVVLLGLVLVIGACRFIFIADSLAHPSI